MNRSASLYQDSRFGPPSEPIDIGQFLASARELDSISTSGSAPSVSPLSKLNIPAFSEFKSLPSSRHEALSAQCSVDDISTQLNATLSSPILTAHIIRSHRAVLSSIFDAVDTSKSRRRARRDVMDPENETNAEVRELQASLDTVQLRAMKLDMQSAIFLRTSTNSDYNALSSVVRLSYYMSYSLLSLQPI
jgi:snRNA-activating protein complex subunit 3